MTDEMKHQRRERLRKKLFPGLGTSASVARKDRAAKLDPIETGTIVYPSQGYGVQGTFLGEHAVTIYRERVKGVYDVRLSTGTWINAARSELQVA